MPDHLEELRLRLADPADAEAIAALYTAARRAAVPWMPPSVHTADEDVTWIAEQLTLPEVTVWLAESDHELLGYALLTPALLDHLFVRPDRIGEGVGGVLLDVAKAEMPDGFSLWVFQSNAPAIRFYTRADFEPVEFTDGADNEEHWPDQRMWWPGTR